MSEPIAAVVPKPGIRRPILLAIIAGGVVLLLLIAAGAWALVTLLLGKNQSATASAVAFPASTVSWTELAVDPSNDQKLGALEFITNLPGLTDAIEDSDLDIDLDDPASNTDLTGSLWEFLVDSEGSGFENVSLDYEDDIKPWLGSRIAYGTLPSDDASEPQLVVAIETKDADAGVDAVEELIDDLDIDGLDLDVSSRNGYVLVSPDYVDLDEAFEAGTLADRKNFSSAADDFGDWGVMSYWSDLGASVSSAVEAYTATLGDYSDRGYWEDQIRANPYSYVPYPEYDYDAGGYVYEDQVFVEYEDYEEYYLSFMLDDLVDEKIESFAGLEDAQNNLVDRFDGTTAYGVLRFTDGALELSGSVNGIADLPEVDADGRALAALPDSTMFALSVSGLAPAIDSALSDDNLSALGLLGGSFLGTAEPVSRADIIDFFDESLGLGFPDDLEMLLGKQLIVSFDEDLDPDSLGSGEDFAAVLETGAAITIVTEDADLTLGAWEDLIDRFEEESGADLGLDLESEGDRVVISAGDYLESVLEPEDSLNASEVFRRALPQADGASSAFFVDVPGMLDLISGGMGDDGAIEDALEGLEGIGMTSTVTSEDSISYQLRVTTERD